MDNPLPSASDAPSVCAAEAETPHMNFCWFTAASTATKGSSFPYAVAKDKYSRAG